MWWDRVFSHIEHPLPLKKLGQLSTPYKPKESEMKTYKLPADSLLVCQGLPGEIIPCDDQKAVEIIKPKDPEPDLATKPKDVVGYCFGYVCPKKHVSGTFETITLDGYNERRVCGTCGGVSQPSIVKKVAEAKWIDYSRSRRAPSTPNWGWAQYYVKGSGPSSWIGDPMWTRYEFVHYLDSPKPRRKK